MEAPELSLVTIAVDEEDDEVDILLTPEPVPAVGVRLDDHVYIRVNPDTRLPVGITITNFSVWAWKRLSGHEGRQWERRRALPVWGAIRIRVRRLVIIARLLLRGPRTGQELLANRKLLAVEVRNLLRRYEQLRSDGRVPLVSSN